MEDGPNKSTSRLEKSSRPESVININPEDIWTSRDAINKELDEMEKMARFKRNQRWENARQAMVLFWFLAFSIVLFLALVLSITTLYVSSDDATRHLAMWVLETLVGGFIAGLIGFWAVKSFER